jgi:hypothetical protein
MSQEKPADKPSHFALSLDSWAVVAALILAVAVRFDLLKKIPW